MMISPELASAFNKQIGHELGASLQYLSIAAHFDQAKLKRLAKLFFEQSAEETQHALKFIHYVLDTKGKLQIPSVPAPAPSFSSAEAAVQAALDWEKEVTAQIKGLMDHAVRENDYLAQNFLQVFIDEQLEEVMQMDQLLSVIQRAGEKNLIMVAAYLVHLDKAD